MYLNPQEGLHPNNSSHINLWRRVQGILHGFHIYFNNLCCNIKLKQSLLCSFCMTQGSILRGERYTLLKNNGSNWDVKDANGRTMSVPAVCFIIPPTDPEAVAVSDKWVFPDLYMQFIMYTLTNVSNLKTSLQSNKPAQRYQTESSQQQICTTGTTGRAEEGESRRSRFVSHVMINLDAELSKRE